MQLPNVEEKQKLYLNAVQPKWICWDFNVEEKQKLYLNSRGGIVKFTRTKLKRNKSCI